MTSWSREPLSKITSEHLRRFTGHNRRHLFMDMERPFPAWLLFYSAYIQQGWPAQCDPNLTPFYSRRSELSLHQGCILWGSQVIVPAAGRKAILQVLELHCAWTSRNVSNEISRQNVCLVARTWCWHWGDCAWMWRVSVNSVFSPSGPIASMEMACTILDKTPPRLCGPIPWKNVSCTHWCSQQWIEVFCTPTSTSAAVIEELRPVFAHFGLPETVVTDNGSCFVSEEFELFLQKNGIKHITSAPTTLLQMVLQRGLSRLWSVVWKRSRRELFGLELQKSCSPIVLPYKRLQKYHQLSYCWEGDQDWTC